MAMTCVGVKWSYGNYGPAAAEGGAFFRVISGSGVSSSGTHSISCNYRFQQSSRYYRTADLLIYRAMAPQQSAIYPRRSP